MSASPPQHTVDARGRSCPLPIVALARESKQASIGASILVLADDNAFPEDVKAWCRKTKNELLSLESEGSTYRAVVRKVTP